jgi:hypothetical protein
MTPSGFFEEWGVHFFVFKFKSIVGFHYKSLNVHDGALDRGEEERIALLPLSNRKI